MSKIYPVLLAGGSGSRLWPLSRKSYPKQFSRLIGEKSLFQHSVERVQKSESLEFQPPIVLTNSDFRFIVGEQLKMIGKSKGDIIIEPESKNTAPAILAACLKTYLDDPDAIILVTPSDHNIPDREDFSCAVRVGLGHVNSGNLVTFGIRPSHAETGYGYLELGTDELDQYGTRSVKKFIEKPSFPVAEKLITKDNYFWNAGIFLFRSRDLIELFKNLQPEMLRHAEKAIEKAELDLDFLRLDPEAWQKVEDISLDFAIMEDAPNLVSVPFSSKWSDLGSWDSIWDEMEQDEFGVALSANAHSIECSNSLLRSENDSQQIVGLGLKNIVAISMPDSVLVADKNRVQDVKKVVQYLTEKNIKQATVFPKDYRPWGWFESLTLAERFQVKRICVKPGASLSLQSHHHRSEHWIVVEGTAKVFIDDETKLVKEGQSVYVPLGAVHRMENPGKINMVLIEVQTGSYLEEDDIIRYEDMYNRKT